MFHYDLNYGDAHVIGVDIFSMPVLDSRMYIIHVNHNELLIIDPVLLQKEDEPRLRAICDPARRATVLVTHSHYDHIAGLNRLRELIPAKLYATPLCNKKLQDSHKNLSAYSMALVMGKDPKLEWYCETHFDFDYTCSADEIYVGTTKLEFSLHRISSNITNNKPVYVENNSEHEHSLLLRTIPTPGHSDCSQCVELRRRGGVLLAVFTGDSLVNGHDTITRFPTGNKRVFREETEPYIMSLPDNIVIFPGHGDPARLSEIKEYAII